MNNSRNTFSGLLVCSLATVLFSNAGLAQSSVTNSKGELSMLLWESRDADRIERTAVSDSSSLVAFGDETGKLGVFQLGGTGALQYESNFVGDPLQWLNLPEEDWASRSAGAILGLAFSPDGSEIIIGLGDGTIKTLVAATGVEVHSENIGKTIATLSLSSTGNKMLVGTSRGEVLIYDRSNSSVDVQLLSTLRPADDSGPVFLAEFQDNDLVIFTSLEGYHEIDDIDGTQGGTQSNAGLTKWDASTGTRLVRFGAPEGSADARIADGDVFCVTQDNVSLKMSPTGSVLASDSFLTGGGLEVIEAGGLGGTFLVSCGYNRIAIVDPLSGRSIIRLDIPNSLDTLNPSSLSTDGPAGTFSVGTFSGDVVSYSFSSASALPHTNPRNDFLGSLGGVDIVATMDLIAHSSPVSEIEVSKNGAYLATRDTDGNAFLWTKEQNGTYSAEQLSLELATAWNNQRVFSFSDEETVLVAVSSDGILHFFDLTNPSLPDTSVSLSNGSGTPIYALSAMIVSSSEVLCGSYDRGLYVFDAQTGVLEETIVGPVPEEDNRTYPYTFLLTAPTPGKVLASPTSVYPDNEPGHDALLLNTSNWSTQSILTDTRFFGGRFSCVNPIYFCLANGAEVKGVSFFNSQTLEHIDGDAIPARVGVACVLNNFALCFDPGKMTVAYLNAGEMITASATISLGSPVYSMGSPANDDEVFVGLRSGQIILLSPSASQ